MKKQPEKKARPPKKLRIFRYFCLLLLLYFVTYAGISILSVTAVTPPAYEAQVLEARERWQASALKMPKDQDLKDPASEKTPLRADLSADSSSDLSSDLSAEKKAQLRGRWLFHNEEALAIRLKMISSAQEKIDLTVYDADTSEESSLIYAALIQAAQRKVKVRMTLDGFAAASRLYRSFWLGALLEQEGIELRFYNPVNLLDPFHFQFRMHEKYLAVDGRYLLCGGRNLRHIFLSQEGDGEDLELLIVSQRPCALVEAAHQRADELHSFSKRPRAIFPPDRKKKMAAEARLNAKMRSLPDLEADLMPIEAAQIFFTSAQNEIKPPELLSLCLEASREGKTSWLTPYIVLEDELMQVFSRKDLQLVTNSLKTGANLPALSDYQFERSRLNAAGVQIKEQSLAPSRHTKALLIGDDLVGIGSLNLDGRAIYINTELMLFVRSEALYLQFQKALDSWLNTTKALPEAMKDPEMDAKGAKAVWLRVLSIFRPLRRLY